MPTASIPSFYSHPVAATRAHFTARTMQEAVLAAFMYALTPYYIYFWFQNDLFYMNLISNSFILLLSVSAILNIRAKRLPDSINRPAFGVYISLFMIWLILFTDAART